MTSPCFKCESRGSCKHRTVEEPIRLAEPAPDKVVEGSAYGIGGLPRKRAYNKHSMRGAKGNPTLREFEEIAKNAFKKRDG